MVLLVINNYFARFCLIISALACVFFLPACVASQSDGNSREMPTLREHNAFKAMILAQPEFTEGEMLKFIADVTPTIDMRKQEALAFLETEKGWPEQRSMYMIFKMGMAAECIVAGKSCAAMFPLIVPELYPSLAESALVRKHRDAVVPLFMPQGRPGASGVAPGTSPGPRP